eukprot:2813882-Rhodomonas_salina.1
MKKNPFPKGRKHSGKRLQFGDKVPPIGQIPKHWRDCKSLPLPSTTDAQLAEYLIGYTIQFHLPLDFYPEDK